MAWYLGAVALLASVKLWAYPTPVDFNGEVLRWNISANQPTITYEAKGLDGLDETIYDEDINEAAAMWTAVNGSYFQFVRAGESEVADVTVNLDPNFADADVSAGYALFDESDENGPIHCDITIAASKSGLTNIRKTTLHEMGHCVGLGHSLIPEAVMSYRTDMNRFALDVDDQAAISRLYPADGSSEPVPPGCAVGTSRKSNSLFACLFLLFPVLLLLRSLRPLLLLSLFVFSSISFGAPRPIDIQGISVFADSIAHDNFGATLRVDMGKITLNDLKTIKLATPEGQSLLPSGKDGLKLLVFVPSDLSGSLAEEFAAEVKSRFTSRVTGSLNVEIVRVDVERAEQQVKMIEQELKYSAKIAPGNKEEASRLANVFITANKYTLGKLKEWAVSFKNDFLFAKRNPEKKAMFYGSIIGGASSLGPSIAFLTITGVNFYAMAQIISTIAFDQLNTRYSTKLIKWETEHQFPFFKNTAPVRFYNQSIFARAVAVNWSIQTTTGVLFRTFAWLNNPAHIAAPLSIEFLTTVGGMNVVSALFTSGTDIGVRSLRKKGYISQRTELLLNSIFNFMAQMNNLIVGTGFIKLLPIGLAVEWGAKGAIIVAGKILPTKGNRVAIIHPEIPESDRANLRYLHDLEETVEAKNLTKKELRKLAEKIKKQKERQAKFQEVKRRAQVAFKALQDKFRVMWTMSCRGLKALQQVFIDSHPRRSPSFAGLT